MCALVFILSLSHQKLVILNDHEFVIFFQISLIISRSNKRQIDMVFLIKCVQFSYLSLCHYSTKINQSSSMKIFSSKLLALATALLIVVITITITTTRTIVDAARRPTAIKPETHHYAPPTEHPSMPDRTLPENKRQLECNSCKVLTQEVWERLHALAKKTPGVPPRHYQQVDLIESMCADVKHEYGLVMRNNKPVLEFSRDDAIELRKGSWINNYLEHRCGKILASHEEQILEKYKQIRDVNEFQSVICKRLERTCLMEEFGADL